MNACNHPTHSRPFTTTTFALFLLLFLTLAQTLHAAPPSITSIPPPPAFVDIEYKKFQITTSPAATGFQFVPQATGSGSLKEMTGLDFNPTTGEISGIPKLAQPNQFGLQIPFFKITAYNSEGPGTPQSSIFTVYPHFPWIESTDQGSVNVGMQFTHQVWAPKYFATDYFLVNHPNFLSINQQSGHIKGTPPLGSEGTYTFNIKATIIGSETNQLFTLKVLPNLLPTPPVIISSDHASGYWPLYFNFQIKTSPPEPPVSTTFWLDKAKLPPGVDYNWDTGLISGKPTSIGVFPVDVMAINNGGFSPVQTLTITISLFNPPDAIVPEIHVKDPIWFIPPGAPTIYRILATSSPTRYRAEGLPDGLKIDEATGVITGIAPTTGTYPVTLYAMNSAGTGTQQVTISVAPPLPPELTVQAIATIGLPFKYQITANNSPTRFDATGLPLGLTLDPVTGVISGIPSTEGTHTILLSASNAAGTDSQPLNLTVSLPSKINFDPARNQVVLMLQDGGLKEQVVEFTDDLKLWTPLEIKLKGAKDVSELDPQSATRAFRFYRVIQR